MIVVIGILQGVRQDKVGLDTAIHPPDEIASLYRRAAIVADIKEFDAGAGIAAAACASSRRTCFTASSVMLPLRHSLADSPRSPKDKQTTWT